MGPRASNLSQARGFVQRHARHFNVTLHAFRPYAVENLAQIVGGPIGVTAGLTLIYDPEYVANQDVRILATDLAHEVMHVQLRHFQRAKSFTDKRRWNYAADLAINHGLRSVTSLHKHVGDVLWRMDDTFLLPEQFGLEGGLTTEVYYALLGDKKLKDPGPGGVGGGNCGGVAGNPGNAEFEAEVDKKVGRSQNDVDRIRKSTAKAMQSSEAKRGGYAAGVWEEAITMAEADYRVPWASMLEHVVAFQTQRIAMGETHRSMARPSKRGSARGTIIPGIVGFPPNVMFCLDTSGSMSSSELGAALRVCCDVLEQTGIDTALLVQVDAKVQSHAEVSTEDLRRVAVKGRGGTSFKPAFTYIGDLPEDERPDLVVYLTDGYGDNPTIPDGVEVVWVVVPPGDHCSATSGTTVFIRELGKEPSYGNY